MSISWKLIFIRLLWHELRIKCGVCKYPYPKHQPQSVYAITEILIVLVVSSANNLNTRCIPTLYCIYCILLKIQLCKNTRIYPLIFMQILITNSSSVFARIKGPAFSQSFKLFFYVYQIKHFSWFTQTYFFILFLCPSLCSFKWT